LVTYRNLIFSLSNSYFSLCSLWISIIWKKSVTAEKGRSEVPNENRLYLETLTAWPFNGRSSATFFIRDLVTALENERLITWMSCLASVILMKPLWATVRLTSLFQFNLLLWLLFGNQGTHHWSQDMDRWPMANRINSFSLDISLDSPLVSNSFFLEYKFYERWSIHQIHSVLSLIGNNIGHKGGSWLFLDGSSLSHRK